MSVTVVIGWIQTTLICCFCTLFSILLCLMCAGNAENLPERMPAPYVTDVMNMVKGEKKKFGEVSAKSKESDQCTICIEPFDASSEIC